MHVVITPTDKENVLAFTLSHGDTVVTGHITRFPDPGDGTMPCSVEYTGSKPNFTDLVGGRSIAIDPDVHVMAAFAEYVNK